MIMAVIDRITGDALDVFDALPPHIAAHIVEAMMDNKSIELSTKQDVLRCWLEFKAMQQ